MASNPRGASRPYPDEPLPPYTPPVATNVAYIQTQPGVTYVVGRNNQVYSLTPDVYVVDLATLQPGAIGRHGFVCRCPRCHSIVETYVERTGCGPWVWLWVLLFLLVFWPLFWVPLVCGFGTGDYVHVCPVCDYTIATASAYW